MDTIAVIVTFVAAWGISGVAAIYGYGRLTERVEDIGARLVRLERRQDREE